MQKLSKQDIFSVKLKPEQLEIPEWGGFIYIRPITLEEQGKLADLGAKYEKANNQARLKECTLSLIEWTVVEEDGSPTFTHQEVAQLCKAQAAAILRIQENVLKISGLTEEARKNLEKNLQPTSASEPDSSSLTISDTEISAI